MKGIFLEWPSGSYYPNQSVWSLQGADTISTGETGSLILGCAFSFPFTPLFLLSLLNGYLMVLLKLKNNTVINFVLSAQHIWLKTSAPISALWAWAGVGTQAYYKNLPFWR